MWVFCHDLFVQHSEFNSGQRIVLYKTYLLLLILLLLLLLLLLCVYIIYNVCIIVNSMCGITLSFCSAERLALCESYPSLLSLVLPSCLPGKCADLCLLVQSMQTTRTYADSWARRTTC